MTTEQNTVDTLAREGESMAVDGTTLRIVRIFDAPRELLYAAWTDPDQLAQWWGPEHLHTPRESVQIDAVVGGIWTATMVVDESGEEFPSTAHFTVVEPPSLLELHEPPSEFFPFDVTARITFEDLGGRTRMTIVQHFDTESFDFGDSITGWGTSLEKLRRLAS
ncbi:SRPBCC family protein [Arthrobacter sp. 35W]|uniref:SRPBCC family protein n=1 Tax=Arthrobacter sp. 35W TaxID=1132441 RepID=UPI000416247D|nr:SRPBCC domain-containing protein [Arthrobacter sp. 35W]